MVVYLPFAGPVTSATGTIMEKIVLRKKKIDVKLYLTSSFFAIVLAMVPFLYFYWKLDSQALQPNNLLIFGLVVLLAAFANLFSMYSIKGDKLNNIEPARILEPLFVILLVLVFSFFFENLYRHDAKVVVPALIGGFALILSHIRKHHLKFNRYFIAAAIGSLLYAFELVVSKLILGFYSPITFYFMRCLSLFVLGLIFFKPDFSQLSHKVKGQIFITGAIWVLYRIVLYYGYLHEGVVLTTLLLMLGPVLIYLFAHFILKERMSWRNFVASLVIIGAVIYALA